MGRIRDATLLQEEKEEFVLECYVTCGGTPFYWEDIGEEVGMKTNKI